MTDGLEGQRRREKHHWECSAPHEEVASLCELVVQALGFCMVP